MDFAVSYQTGGGGSFTGTGMNMLRLLVALLTFSSIPILLFQTSMDIYGTVRSVVVGSMDGATVSITDLVKGAVQSMFKSVYGTLPPVKIANGNLGIPQKAYRRASKPPIPPMPHFPQMPTGGRLFSLSLVWAIFKIFFSNLKRGGILLVQICVGSMHMLALARGYTDGFGSWCKQVAALCFTAFVQNLLYLLAIIMMQDAASSSLYFSLGLLLVAAEVPRIAQMFGLDTSARVSLGNAAHNVSSVVSLVKQFA